MPDPDHDLIRRLTAGDRAALAELYDRHAGLCYRAALTAGGSACIAEDAVQEVFVRLADDPTKPAAAANLTGYLLRMAQHAAIDLRRRPRRQAALDEALAAAPPADGDDDRDRRVLAAVASLSPEQRTVVQLRIWEERSLEEIGEILDVSPNTVSSRWRYAIVKLTQLLKGCHDS